MKNGTLLLVDSDELYLRPLEQSVIDTLGQTMDIHVISDPAYLKVFFSQPHDISMLLIHESLYDPAWEKQNIAHICLLTEQVPNASTPDAEKRIYKYSSVKEIVQKISQQLSSGATALQTKKQATRIVLVASAQGGAGKSTIARGLANRLARLGQRVLLIAADGLQSLGQHLYNAEPLSDDAAMAFMGNNPYVYEAVKAEIRNELFDYIPPFKYSLPSMQIAVPELLHFIRCARSSEDYDILLVDAPSDFSVALSSLMAEANLVLLVCKQHAFAKANILRLLSQISIREGQTYQLLINTFVPERKNVWLSAADCPIPVGEYIESLPNAEGAVSTDDIASTEAIERLAYQLL